MRSILALLIGLGLFILPSFGEVPVLSMPASVEVLGNGLHAVSFVVEQSAVSPEVQGSLRYFLEGQPAENPATFDETSKLFFWRPESTQVGSRTFTLMVKDPFGNQTAESIVVNVLDTPSVEALPKRWEDFKDPEKYLKGRGLLPSSNYIEAKIAALPQYEIEVKVKDSMGQDCVLTYVPKDGRNKVSKKQRKATILMGGQYASEYVKTVRRDLYEDLFSVLDLVFKRIESIKIKGAYQLKDFQIFDRPALVSAVGTDDIYLPRLNIAFDDRFYEETLYSKKEPILISDIPVIKIDLSTSSGLIWRRARLFVDDIAYESAWGDFSMIVIKPYKEVSSFDMEYAMYMLKISSAKKLPFGEHHFLFEVENAYGMLISREVFARVVTIPTQIEGKPLVFPNPYNPAHGEVKIQYRLSMQANIELVIFGADGSTVMKQRYSMGDEGGKKGLNTVSWNGKSESGMMVSNGIFIGALIDKDENRIMDKFRLTVFR